MNPTLTEQPQLRVASLRHRGPYQQIGETFARLAAIVEAAGASDASPELVAVYHDDPATVPAANLRSDAGILVPAGTALPEGLSEVILAAGPYVQIRHSGPYDTLPKTWARIREFFAGAEGPKRGDGPGYEIYRNTPATAAPADLITDIYVPTA
ncbi:MAG: GyrI-like domain-containing protein [Vicinamibacterales bacterium]